MLSLLWQFFAAIADYRSWTRAAKGEPVLDVVFISNLRNEQDRRRFLGRHRPKSGHFNGPRLNIKNINARVRTIDSTAEEMLTTNGRRKAKEQFIRATVWAQHQGTKVILLAASTKRLFGRDGQELKRRFPSITFTIGDNGTALMLLADVYNLVRAADIGKSDGKILIIGPYGILGDVVTKSLMEDGYNVIGMGTNTAGLSQVAERYSISTYNSFSDISGVDLVVACTHSKDAMLTAKVVKRIANPHAKLYVVDIAEPDNLSLDEYKKCAGRVVRQDAGNAYSEGLAYVLEHLTLKLFGLSKGVAFGCFAEAIAIAHAIESARDNGFANMDFFHVGEQEQCKVAMCFSALAFRAPAPRSYGVTVPELCTPEGNDRIAAGHTKGVLA